MKKLLILLALFTFAALGAQDAAVTFWAGNASYTFHTFYGPNGDVAQTGWLIVPMLDAAGDGIDGLDTVTRMPVDDDAFPSNPYPMTLNGLAGAGTWYGAGVSLPVYSDMTTPEPCINIGDYMYFVLYNATTAEEATHYTTCAASFVGAAASGPQNNPIEDWLDDNTGAGWTEFGEGPDEYNDATNPYPADGAVNVMTGIGMLQFDYDDTGADVPAVFDVYFGSDNPPMMIHETIPYTGAGVFFVNIPNPLLENDTFFWSVVPTDGSRAVTRKSNNAQRQAQISDTREPAVWSFTTEGATQTQMVPGGGTVQFAFGDGVTIDVSGVALGGNLEIIEYATPPQNLLHPENCLPLWFDIDPAGAWTEFPVNIVITWTTPAPVGNFFELAFYNVGMGQWMPFVDGADGVINGHNYTTAPYWVDFDAAHFTEYAMSNGAGTTLPVEFAGFMATPSADFDFVTLAWSTQSETDMMGFNVLRSEDLSVANAVRINPNIIPATNTTNLTEYQHVDNEIENNSTYYYWVEAIDNTGSSFLSQHRMVTISNEVPHVINVTELNAAYPNPFNPTTTIAYSVKHNETGTLTIYNVLGQVVKTFNVAGGDNGIESSIQWHGVDNNGQAVGSGIYFYKLDTPSYNKINKMLLLK